MRSRLVVALAGALVAIAAAGAHAQDDAAAAQSAAATISGRVVAADTGRPIRFALVRAVSPQGRQLYASSDPQGRFEFKDLVAGTYRLDVRAERYLPMQFGGIPYDGRTAVPPKPIEVKPGERFERADFAMPRPAAVEGTVVDEFGDPAPGITVQLSRLEYGGGRRRLMPAGARVHTRITDDRGRFRLFGVQPGDYYLSALSGAFTEQNETGGFSPTYFPGTPDAAAAQPIRLRFGQDVTAITLQLVPAKMTKVAGRMIDAEGRPVAQGTVTLSLSDRLGVSDFFITRGVTAADGTFAFRNVPPGSYTLQGYGRQTASAGNLGASEFGWLPVSAGDADQTELVLAVTRGSALRGRVVLEEPGGPPLRSADVSVSAIPVQFDSAPVGGGPPPSRMNEDLSFEVSNLSGHRLIMAGARNPAWSLKRITIDGRDVTDQAVDFTTGDVEKVEVVLTSRAPSLSGSVTDAQGRPLSDYTVILFGADQARWTDRSRYVQLARAAPGGRFTFRGVPPESYLVVALPFVNGSEWQDPDVLETLRDLATGVTLSEGDATTIELKLQQRR
jgi:protocatechuate 3,4-dioxygenase beta subunit